ncbi:hypothetical protein HK099_006782 [Clydaea vesicula]|uniref:SH3 domain-containing protein n=1 Tax=Clydaea vesicula TaxID=447962 RepID=A0AAD5U236_9FUNG|nr:hypothetical protein HK099_006782 [Clydaea vesicula]
MQFIIFGKSLIVDGAIVYATLAAALREVEFNNATQVVPDTIVDIQQPLTAEFKPRVQSLLMLKYEKLETRNDSLLQEKTSNGLNSGIKYVKKSFLPTKDSPTDEIALLIGDPVSISKKYEDGWAFGINWKNNFSGIFPMSAIEE